jgi:hypothetical protein
MEEEGTEFGFQEEIIFKFNSNFYLLSNFDGFIL